MISRSPLVINISFHWYIIMYRNQVYSRLYLLSGSDFFCFPISGIVHINILENVQIAISQMTFSRVS